MSTKKIACFVKLHSRFSAFENEDNNGMLLSDKIQVIDHDRGEVRHTSSMASNALLSSCTLLVELLKENA